MAKVVIEIPDALAGRIERQKSNMGFDSLDDAAGALLSLGLLEAESVESDDLWPDTETLQAMVDEAEASGPTRPWNSEEAFAEIRARYLAEKKASA